MGKEIIFRGKSINDNGWIEGYYVGNNTIVKTEDMMYNLGYIDDSRCYECHPESIGQFTGRKDVNGKNIYEGDVICGNFPYASKCLVEWDGNRCCFYLKPIDGIKKAGCDIGYKMNSAKVNIIGNIWDNKDLIKNDDIIS